MTLRNWLRSLWRQAPNVANQSRHKDTAVSASVNSSLDGYSGANADDSLDPYNPFPEPVEIEIGDVIDLHTIPPRDVKRVVHEYLLQAHASGFKSVRIIHGKGIGVQRNVVHAALARMPFVATWAEAPPEAGGLGATVVHFHQASE
jgi:Smr domain